MKKKIARQKGLNNLTYKEERLVKAMVDSNDPQTFRNAAGSWRKAYEKPDEKFAAQRGYDVINRPRVKRALKELLEDTDIQDHIKEGLEKFCREGKDSTDWKDKKVAMEAFRLYGEFTGAKQPEQHLHVQMSNEQREEKYKRIRELVRREEQNVDENKKEF